MAHRILFIDDDRDLTLSLKGFLEARGYQVDAAFSGAEGVTLLTLNPGAYSVVVVDYLMEGLDGVQTTQALTSLEPDLTILVYTGDSSPRSLLLNSRSGSSGIVSKGEGPGVLLTQIENACKRREAKSAIPTETATPAALQRLGLVGRSKALMDIAKSVAILKEKNGPVLILGESGTGKEHIARGLHRSGPFIAVNCADYLLSTSTARSELFGHAKGAFTGAERDKPGLFEMAANGTVFLDEIYCLPPEAQIGLLRALQEKKITRMGETKERPISCRIITAAKPDLMSDTALEGFKPDLYYRISQNIIHVPPLRNRPEDIELLLAHFTEKWAEENRQKKFFRAETLSLLERYSWPGNVRELENIVYGLLNICQGESVGATELGGRFTQHRAPVLAGALFPLKTVVTATEKHHIISVASQCGTLKEAAARLGLTPQNLIRLFKKHGLRTEQVIKAIHPRRGRG